MLADVCKPVGYAIDLSGGGVYQTSDALQHCGLARAVDSHDRGGCAGFEPVGDIVESVEVVESNGQVLNFHGHLHAVRLVGLCRGKPTASPFRSARQKVSTAAVLSAVGTERFELEGCVCDSVFLLGDAL